MTDFTALSLAERLALLDRVSQGAAEAWPNGLDDPDLAHWCARYGMPARTAPVASSLPPPSTTDGPVGESAPRSLFLPSVGLSLLVIGVAVCVVIQVPGLRPVLQHAALTGLGLPMRGCLP